jgi:ferrous iron transport protein A
MDITKKMILADGKKGQFIKITNILVEGVMRRIPFDLGFVPGAIVEVARKSPLGDPIAFKVCQTLIALRKEESKRIIGELMES